MQGERLRQRRRLACPRAELPLYFPAVCSTELFPTRSSNAVPARPMPCAPLATRTLKSEIVNANILCLWWVTASPANITGTRLLLSSFTEPFLHSALVFIRVVCGFVTSKCDRVHYIKETIWTVCNMGKTYHETYCFRFAWSNEQKERGEDKKILNSLLLLTILMTRVSHFWIGQK